MFSLSCVLLQEHTENHADGPPAGGPPQLTSNPTTSWDANTFYAQLDSLPAGDFDLADAGLIHVWVCFDCFYVTASLDSA